MKWVYRLVTLAYFLIAVPRVAWCLMRDYQQLESWGDLNHNFPLELALLGVFITVVAALGWQVWTAERKRRAR